MTRRPALLTLVLSAAQVHAALHFHSHPPPPLRKPPVAAVPAYEWSVSTLREQVHGDRVSAAAFHLDDHSIEVLSNDGLTHRVAIFPAAFPATTSMLVEDMRQEHITFFVAREQQKFDPFVLLMVRAALMTMLTLCLVELLGLTEQLVLVWLVMGLGVLTVLAQLEELMVDAWEETRRSTAVGMARLSATWQALMCALGGVCTLGASSRTVWRAEPITVRVEEDDDPMIGGGQ